MVVISGAFDGCGVFIIQQDGLRLDPEWGLNTKLFLETQTTCSIGLNR